ncbi:Type IIB DNA topoisomerase family protein [Candida parapsilosis]|uniref:DNA topoisomerase (ATP-hydrolyzing) n=2 Tax=Candida parapsilosis TaxID=5480 RepID=G8BAJ6_CANPC|nr:uncharacterized protein CPAR2_806190 [Candida parapsilosis]KAF6051968.1 Type IIB DNA topoisomerase family protein [Candida parapsilosis]KAF6052535.1 Type IIB DNA topoisomerase family protein [Candida parapsilosis]KAF6053770.1 Type IIB DNA topoisomerase family protein [Candida parapsilosis]KAF6064311.1 Type IIB DNA topoisomerase family protein [Candida parapsilosis]KAI5904679.1 Meiosis-specific protein SPO11 [Candida parapsilosis]
MYVVLMKSIFVTNNIVKSKLQILEDIWQQLVRAFEKQSSISLVIYQNCNDSHSYRKLMSLSTPSVFASNCAKLAALIKLIKILKQNLTLNKSTTIRDIYYQDIELFNKDQQECRRMLTDLVENCLGWSLAQDFNIHPTQKGLTYGNIFQQMQEPVLIPIDYCNYFKWNCSITPRSSLLIIVLEKDAVFHSFSKYMQLQSQQLHCNYIILTGKGFSDNLTQRFASWLARTYCTTTLGFFDSDAHGLLIYKRYKNAVPDIKYSGMYLLESSLNSQLTASTRDVSIMSNLSSTSMVSLGPKVHRELTRGLFLYKKAEMNVVSKDEYNSYILGKVCSQARDNR